MTRRTSVAIAVTAMVAVSACTSGDAGTDLTKFAPLVAAWEADLAGQAPGTGLADELRHPSLRLTQELPDAVFAYQVLDERPTIAMWQWHGRVQPFESEGHWEHRCATLEVGNNALLPTAVDCPSATPQEPPADALPQDRPADPQQKPWGQAADVDLDEICSPDTVEVVADLFQRQGPRDTARLSVRNIGDRPCEVAGRPGLRLTSDGAERVVAMGGGRQMVRLAPGQSTWSTVSWRPTSSRGVPTQTLEATLGILDPVEVQMLRSIDLDQGMASTTPWAAPTNQAPPEDQAPTSAQTIAPLCDARRVRAQVVPDAASTGTDRTFARLQVTNTSYLPCRFDRMILRRDDYTTSVEFAPEQPVLLEPGRPASLSMSWPRTVETGPGRWVLDTYSGAAVIDTRQQLLPRDLTVVEIGR